MPPADAAVPVPAVPVPAEPAPAEHERGEPVPAAAAVSALARRPVRRGAVRQSTDLDWEGTPVRLVRSTARTRTVSAAWREGRLQVNVPARLTPAQEREWIARMVEQVAHRAGAGASLGRPGAGSRPGSGPGAGSGGDEALMAWAQRLSAAHLGGRARPASVAWSARQRRRWGSCTPSRGTIRLSDRLRGMPDWVVAAVLVHELAHLLESGHGPAFRRLVAAYPRYAEAMAFLDGVAFAESRGRTAPDAWADDEDAMDADAPDDGPTEDERA
ncbi:SprT-like domain-containing protein [Micrococcus endophyticus]|uniref:M48 family metallopeptidase n=1 Tax=Micrococcus endophyticus TaxID=455343 RepID=UPI0037FA1F7A